MMKTSRRHNNHGKSCKPSNCGQAPEMKFGVCMPNYGETCSTDAIQRVAVAAEDSGYDSVWCTDHVLLPRNSNTPYERILDSISTLAYLSAMTRRVRLGISSLITHAQPSRCSEAASNHRLSQQWEGHAGDKRWLERGRIPTPRLELSQQRKTPRRFNTADTNTLGRQDGF